MTESDSVPRSLLDAVSDRTDVGDHEIRVSGPKWTAALGPDVVPAALQSATTISRDAVFAVAADAVRGEASPTALFVASMMWGFGPVGYGAWRTKQMLQSGDSAPRLYRVLDRVTAGGATEGYSALATSERIRGLGPAFGTKYLYFAGFRTGAEPRPLILDRVVADWIAKSTDLRLNPWKWDTTTYATYLHTIRRWSDTCDRAPDVIEHAIFKLGTT